MSKVLDLMGDVSLLLMVVLAMPVIWMIEAVEALDAWVEARRRSPAEIVEMEYVMARRAMNLAAGQSWRNLVD